MAVPETQETPSLSGQASYCPYLQQSTKIYISKEMIIRAAKQDAKV
jgi:hypothetical protein